ncbi:MAG: glycine betaine/L-proline ABC transporter substrate-binding protein ProX, partial [Chloroflexota bacterium]
VMGRATWDTGWFQAEVYKLLIEELGYSVARLQTYDSSEFYQKVAVGGADLWVNGWFPSNDELPASQPISDTVEVVGTTVEQGAYEAYVVDLHSAQQFSLTSLADLANPETASHFDGDGNGKAELVGCDYDLVCHAVIEHHIDSYGLRDTVEQVSGEYILLTRSALRRYDEEQSILLYTWMPNWVLERLELGKDVQVLEAPFATHPNMPDINDEQISISGLSGCPSDPCLLGFPTSDIRPVANSAFLDARPAIRRLLELVKIPLQDIASQNLRMVDGESSMDDIRRQARQWIAENRRDVDVWLAEAHAVGLETETLPPHALMTSEEIAEVSKVLRVIALPQEPFVMYDAGQFFGFSVDFINTLAEEIGYDVDIHVVSSMAKLLDEIERGAADVGMGGINITAQREQFIDFSLPIMNSGLKIMVTAESAQNAASLWYQFVAIFSPEILYLIAFLFIMLLVSSHVIWFVERHDNTEFPRAYWPGIADAFWWSAVTITTVGYGDKTPRGTVGRVIGLIWMFMGLFIIAYFTAGVTSSITLNKLNGFIDGPEDLIGKSVATVSDSTAAEYLEGQRVRLRLVAEIEEAYLLLDDGEVDAIVYDAVVLDYHAQNHGVGTYVTVGDAFQESHYGYMLGDDSPTIEHVNLGLLKIRELNLDKSLFARWFGDLSEAD